MVSLIDIYEKENGAKKLFSEMIVVEWYDGCTQGACKVYGLPMWFICTLVYIDFVANCRIFRLIPVSEDWVFAFEISLKENVEINQTNWERVQKHIQNTVTLYSGTSYLFNGRKLNEPCYQLVEMDSKDLPHLYNFEEVVNQTDQEKAKWINYFT